MGIARSSISAVIACFTVVLSGCGGALDPSAPNADISTLSSPPSSPSASSTLDSNLDPQVYFQTPDENITCGVVNNSDGELAANGETPGIGCFIDKTSYDTHGDCEGADNLAVYYVELDRSGRADDLSCSRGAIQGIYGFNQGFEAAVIEPGTVNLDAARCVVSSSAVSCVNHDGHGFYLSKDSRLL